MNARGGSSGRERERERCRFLRSRSKFPEQKLFLRNAKLKKRLLIYSSPDVISCFLTPASFRHF